MSPILDTIQQAARLLSGGVWAESGQLPDADLVAGLAAAEGLGRFADATRVFLAGEVADRSRYELGAEGLSMLGEVLPPERPVVAEALANGLIGVDTAHTILFSLKQAATGSEATLENMDAAELVLVQAGTADSADAVADAGRLWRDALDPDGIEPRYEEIRARRGIFVGRERNGIKKYTINAAPTLAAELDAVFLDSIDPKAGPRFLNDEDLQNTIALVENEDRVLVETVVDPRTIEQKRADILEGVMTAGLRATREGPATMRTIGTVTAVIQLNDLRRGTGFGILEGTDEVLPASTIQEMVCDTGYYTVRLGAKGEPLHHSLLLRYFTQTQRRAMIARDGDRCIAKGCTKRAAGCHAHHVIFSSNDGPTDIDNGTNSQYVPTAHL